MAGVMRRHRRLSRAKRGRLAHLKRWRSRASGVRGRDRHPRSPRPLLRWHRRKTLRAPKTDRPLSFICLIASKSNAGRTEVCLTPGANYSTLITRHPYMRTLRERQTDNTCEGTGGASVWVHGERVVAVPQHATRRCGGCAGMVWRWARERERESAGGFCCLPHAKLASFSGKGRKEANQTLTENRLARRHPHHASGSRNFNKKKGKRDG